MFDMINIFEVFLPQLLRYPNPTDPLNGEAAALLMRDSGAYESRVKGRNLSFSFFVLEWGLGYLGVCININLSRPRLRHQIRYQGRRR